MMVNLHTLLLCIQIKHDVQLNSTNVMSEQQELHAVKHSDQPYASSIPVQAEFPRASFGFESMIETSTVVSWACQTAAFAL